jgi:hypothetical protein
MVGAVDRFPYPGKPANGLEPMAFALQRRVLSSRIHDGKVIPGRLAWRIRTFFGLDGFSGLS